MLALITEINKRDLLNTLTDAGLIPNYAFPEAGIELMSMLWRKNQMMKVEKGVISPCQHLSTNAQPPQHYQSSRPKIAFTLTNGA